MNIQAIISQMLILFTGIALGYIANKCHIMDADFNRKLSQLVLHVTTPFMVLNSVIGSEKALSNHDVFVFTIVAFAAFAVSILVAQIVPYVLRAPAEQRGVYRFMTIFSNAIYMGVPIVQAVFGTSAVFYAAIYLLPFTLISYTYGVYLVSGQAKFNPKLLLSPSIIAILVSYGLYLYDWSAPQVLIDASEFIGRITTPAAMLIIGASLANLPLRSVVTDVRVYAYSAIRLIAMPIIVYYIMRVFVSNELILGMITILVAMPAATNATMMCSQYGGDTDTASKGIFISTLLSIFSIPLIMWLLFLR
jgi:hypothetical protein